MKRLILYIITFICVCSVNAQVKEWNFDNLKSKAEQGDADAQYNLAIYYINGIGVEKSDSLAVVWLTKAAKQDHVGAQNDLGAFFYNGNSFVLQNYVQAAILFGKSAYKGESFGQYNLGLCYYYGHGVTQDYIEAAKWFRKSAEQGYAEAQYMMGWCYYNGFGVTKNYANAVTWFYMSAIYQGHAEAQYMMGECYKLGIIVFKDFYQAEYWYKKAAEQGNVNAIKALDELKEIDF